MKVKESYILNCLNQHVLNWLSLSYKDKNTKPFTPESYPKELYILIKYLGYSMEDITKYQDLSEREQQFISKENFEKMFLSPAEERKQRILQGAQQEISETLQKLLNEGFDEPDLQNLLNNLKEDIPTL